MNADRPHIGAVIDERYPDLVAAARPAAGQILHDLGVRYVLMHEEKSPPQLLRFVEDALPLREVERWRAPTGQVHRPRSSRMPWKKCRARRYARARWSTTPVRSIWVKAGRRCRQPMAYAMRRAPNPVLLLDLPEQGGELTWTGSHRSKRLRSQ